MPVQRGENYSKVIELRNKIPCATLEEIGNKLGITRERVRQILNKENQPTKHYTVTYHCARCGVVIPKSSRSGLCFKCKKEYNRIPIACDKCGKIFYTIPSEAKRGTRFCSGSCRSSFIGNTYGFVVHPENILLGNARGKRYDHAAIYKQFLNSNLNPYRFAKKTGIPAGTIYFLLRKEKR